MKILYLSQRFSFEKSGIYADLMKKLASEGNDVTIVSCDSNCNQSYGKIKKQNGCKLVYAKVEDQFGGNVLKKALVLLQIPSSLLRCIKKTLWGEEFDLILYPTPPITFSGVVKKCKKRFDAKAYLMLKDIFPQNAVDLNMFSQKSIIYKYYRRKELALYKVSDYIGCMSQANVDYLLKHNPHIDREIVHVLPNSVEAIEENIDNQEKCKLREKYGIKKDVNVFLYGGNLGKPQGIPFLIECLKANANKSDRFFVICGDGTEDGKLKKYIDEENPDNILFINGLPKEEYERFVAACDVGLIFLDHRFTIPNFPARILSYMKKKMPVLACTDPNTDMGEIITENRFGWWCESNNVSKFTETVELALNADLKTIGVNGYKFLEENYTVEKAYKIICGRVFK